VIFNLQALRALAALLVITVHVAPLFGVSAADLDNPRFGMVGVDLFFVISGFIMVYTTGRKPLTPASFLVDRAIRVVPLYWAVTAVYFVLGLTHFAAFKALQPTFGTLLKSLLFIPYVNPKGGINPLLYVGWTLNYEMFFYVIFALSLLVRSVGLRVGLMAAGFAGLVLLGWLFHPAGTVAYFYTQPIILEFIMGMILGLAHLEGRVVPAWLTWPLLLAGLVCLFGQFAFPVGQRAWFSGLPSMAIVAAALALETQGRRVENRHVMLLGAASYALYVTHTLLVSMLVKLVQARHVDLGLVGASGVTLFIMVGACLLAIAVHRLFERPVGAWLRARAGHRRSVVDVAEGKLAQSAN
jgi:exopolysaccharide production protein ExoZ